MSTTTGKERPFVIRPWSLLIRLLMSLLSVLLVYWASGWFESFWESARTNFNANEIWRWFVGAGFLVLAGLVIGLAIRQHPVAFRQFYWYRAAALGIAPFLFAMTMPATIWGWPGTSLGGPLWSVQVIFSSDPNTRPLWILVGAALAAGFGTTASAEPNSPATPDLEPPG